MPPLYPTRVLSQRWGVPPRPLSTPCVSCHSVVVCPLSTPCVSCHSVGVCRLTPSLPHACPVTALECAASPPLYPTRVLSQRWGVPPHPLSTPCVSCHSVGVCRLTPSLPHACPVTALGCAASPPLYPMRVLSQRWGVPPLYPMRVLSQRWGVQPHPLSTPCVSCHSVGVCPLSTPCVSCHSVGVCRLTPSLPHACPVTALGCATSLPHACPVTALGCAPSLPHACPITALECAASPPLYPTRVLSQRWGVQPHPLSTPCVSCHSVGVCSLTPSLPHACPVTALWCAPSLPHACPVTALGCAASPPLYPMRVLSQRWGVPPHPLSTPRVSCHSVGVCRLTPPLPHACPVTALGCAASPPLYPMCVLSQRWGVPPRPLSTPRVSCHSVGVCPLSTPCVSCHSVGVCRLTPSLPHACPVTALGCAASPPLYPMRVLSQRWGVPPHPLSTPCVSCQSVGVCRLAPSLPHACPVTALGCAPSLPHACPVTALGCAASPPLYPMRVLSQRWGVPAHPLSTPCVSCHSVGVCPLSTPCVSCHSVGVCRLTPSLPHACPVTALGCAASPPLYPMRVLSQRWGVPAHPLSTPCVSCHSVGVCPLSTPCVSCHSVGVCRLARSLPHGGRAGAPHVDTRLRTRLRTLLRCRRPLLRRRHRALPRRHRPHRVTLADSLPRPARRQRKSMTTPPPVAPTTTSGRTMIAIDSRTRAQARAHALATRTHLHIHVHTHAHVHTYVMRSFHTTPLRCPI